MERNKLAKASTSSSTDVSHSWFRVLRAAPGCRPTLRGSQEQQERQGHRPGTWEGQTNNTLQSYLCFSSCMSLPPTLKAKMSLLVLAYLSFSLVRSGESWSPQAARQKESR